MLDIYLLWVCLVMSFGCFVSGVSILCNNFTNAYITLLVCLKMAIPVLLLFPNFDRWATLKMINILEHAVNKK
jgi:hypothetical protein